MWPEAAQEQEPPGLNRSAVMNIKDWQKALIPLIFLALTGCYETGDFGRRKPGLFEGKKGSDLFPARFDSNYTWTEDETELRNRSVVLLFNPRPPTLPSIGRIERNNGVDSQSYYSRIAGVRDQSVLQRYQRILLDIADDLELIPIEREVACRVVATDKFRVAAIKAARGLTEEEVMLAKERVAENDQLIDSVEASLPKRIDAYHYALTRLMAGSPDRKAVEVEQAIRSLRAEVAKGLPCPRSGGRGGGSGKAITRKG